MKHKETFNIWPILALAILLITMLALASCNSNAPNKESIASVEIKNDSLNSIIQFLLTSSATDFHLHQHPAPVAFRNVKVAHRGNGNTEKLYFLSGEFLSPDKKEKNEWMPFTTIKTSGYEQWIGGQALAFSKDTGLYWDVTTDLSVVLKSRLDSLQ